MHLCVYIYTCVSIHICIHVYLYVCKKYTYIHRNADRQTSDEPLHKNPSTAAALKFLNLHLGLTGPQVSDMSFYNEKPFFCQDLPYRSHPRQPEDMA